MTQKNTATVEKRTKIDGDLFVQGDLQFDPEGESGTIEVHGSILCANLHVRAGWSIRASGSIRAFGHIRAGWSIRVKRSIDAGGDIDADGDIDAGEFIRASGDIDAADGFISAGGDIRAGGFISAGWSIHVKRSISAGGFISAGGDIRAGGDVDAGQFVSVDDNIDAGGFIRADAFIDAGGFIDAKKYILSLRFEVSCASLSTKGVPFWREFYLICPLLQKHHKVIREKCWDEIREALKPEANEICAWEGWPPIVRAQLEMFLGLRDSVRGEKLKLMRNDAPKSLIDAEATQNA